MNFKIYVEIGLEKLITSINDYTYTHVSLDLFKPLIENHIASKISQSFIFFITTKMIEPLSLFMAKHGEAKYQFVIIGSKFSEDVDIPMTLVLGMKRKSITREDLEWYIAKFTDFIRIEHTQAIFSAAETKDFIEDQHELMSIGQMLVVERDRDKLIQKILMTSLKITGADAGSVFLVVDMDNGEKGLLFKYSYTFSRPIDFKEFVMPLNEKSISGFCAVNNEVVNIPDVYNIDKNATFSFNRSIDEKYDYISRSMLVIPMKNYLGEILGVIQLINSKENFNNIDINDETEAHNILLETKEDFFSKIHPFAIRYEDIMLSVAGQASVALDNIKMIKQLEDQFEGLVRASVDAIDSKDPATSGHSDRVSKMSIIFLNRLNKIDYGQYKKHFYDKKDIKQIEYAALLHDYGKVYIDNEIFLKAKKLFPKDFSILMLRLDLIIESLKNREQGNRSGIVDEVIKIRGLVSSLNEPRIFHENPQDIIDSILDFQEGLIVYDGDNNKIPLLTEKEIINLQIARGTLNNDERREIESHVTYSYNFLQSIPWPKELSRIPEIAGGHHEMLDGTGYPRRLTAKDLSTEARVLAILDIFDALSASDRPYKKAVPFDKVQSILLEEGERGRLDKGLINVFLKYKIYEGFYSLGSDSVMV